MVQGEAALENIKTGNEHGAYVWHVPELSAGAGDAGVCCCTGPFSGGGRYRLAVPR